MWNQLVWFRRNEYGHEILQLNPLSWLIFWYYTMFLILDIASGDVNKIRMIFKTRSRIAKELNLKTLGYFDFAVV